MLLTISDKHWLVSIANQPWELIQGLGGITAIPPGTGMLFDLGREQIIRVTTEPMLFSLDIAFISQTLAVTEVYRNIEPGYLVTSDLPARYFLEVNAGEMEDVAGGDRVSTLEISSAETADWMSPLLGFVSSLGIGVLAVGLVRNLGKGWFEEERPEHHSIPPDELKRIADRYGWWSAKLAEAICPHNDVACVEREAKRLTEARRARRT